MATDEFLLRKIETLEARLRAVEDVEAIRRLKARYGQLADSRYHKGRARPRNEIEPIAEALAALFSEDAIWDGGTMGRIQGRAAIAERFAEPTLNFSWHYFVKPLIEVDAERPVGAWHMGHPGAVHQHGRRGHVDGRLRRGWICAGWRRVVALGDETGRGLHGSARQGLGASAASSLLRAEAAPHATRPPRLAERQTFRYAAFRNDPEVVFRSD